MIDAQKFSPAEIGLGKLVDLKKETFVGREALAREAKKGAERALVGLEINWNEVEASVRQDGHGAAGAQHGFARGSAGISRRASSREGHVHNVVADAEENDRAGMRGP